MAKILFVQNINCEMLGIMSISSYVNNKHEVDVAFGSNGEIIEKCRTFKPDVIGISLLSAGHQWGLDISKSLKSCCENSIILIGGPHPTFFNEIIKHEYVDAICIGEGEKPVLNLLNKIDSNEDINCIRSIWIKRNNKVLKNDIEPLLKKEEIPIPDRMLYRDMPHIYDSQNLRVMCSRGCRFKCNYCTNYSLTKLYNAPLFRNRAINDILDEIKVAQKHKNITSVTFHDDIFGADKKWTKDFLCQYKKEINLPFWCLLQCTLITESLIDQLKEAGCYWVGVGVESGDEYIRNTILGKNVSGKIIEKACSILNMKKVKFNTYNMFHMPEESYSESLKTLELNIRIKPTYAYSSTFQPYPGTRHYSEDIKDKVLSADFNRFDACVEYSKDSKKILRLRKLFSIIVRFPVIKLFLPVLVRVPMDYIYDKISKYSWHFLYYKKVYGK